MPNITIVIQIDDEDSDPRDPTGLTNEAYERVVDPLGAQVAGIVDVRQGGE